MERALLQGQSFGLACSIVRFEMTEAVKGSLRRPAAALDRLSRLRRFPDVSAVQRRAFDTEFTGEKRSILTGLDPRPDRIAQCFVSEPTSKQEGADFVESVHGPHRAQYAGGPS